VLLCCLWTALEEKQVFATMNIVKGMLITTQLIAGVLKFYKSSKSHLKILDARRLR
jgi:hypothetical protein